MEIALNRFTPRDFQIPLLDAIENKGYTRALCIWPRRAGKDICAWNLMIRAAIRRVGIYFYCLPTFRQAKLVIWDSITNDGIRFLEYIPSELIESTNSQELKIRLVNGSLIQLIGSDSYDTSLVGTNPRMVVFSEYALADPQAYSYVRPILTANAGTAIFVSTPRGKNHLYDMYQLALDSDNWFCEKLTVETTDHISIAEIKHEIATGEISEDLANQEYWTDFNLGIEGAIYGKYLDKAKLDNRLGEVPWDSSAKVHTAWDIGRDTTSIIFFQHIGQTVKLIDYFEKAGENLEFFIKLIAEKPYLYGRHFFPHDMAVTEWAGPKFTRVEKARQLGLKATIVDDVGLEDGIEHVRSAFGKLWIDERRCSKLIKCVENYRREYDSTKRVYGTKPLHNWASHGCDALRYMCIALPKTKDGSSAEDLEKRYRDAMFGDGSNLPPMFRDSVTPHHF